ncbi:hypothetical protein [Brucella thiophenivorans]|uniref:Outer membrane protein beta-barrel domain-containing protein n=1 Tax=Brucella thiophenivorans TaxID=571255 RepID=A0A256F8H3_9HYPH|nr:hypothetical protein [Brucella thiophenivorans]OYR11108.1 hypothetical protein CEV31_3873 [Brucella thiophenivorans]
MRHYKLFAISFTALMVTQYGAVAADILLVPVASELEKHVVVEDEWRFSASPYFWAAGISGTAGQFGLPPTKMSMDFGNLLDDLNFSFMGVMEGHYDRYSLISDIIYTKISAGGQTPLGVMSTSVDVSSETFSGFFGGGYSVLQDGANRLDVVAGGRIWYVSTEISFDGGLLGGHSGRDSAAWIDAVAGLRGKYFLTDTLYFSVWGVVGAGQAKIDWDLAATFGYQFKDNLSAVAGYRALGVDYSHDGFIYDVVQQGPILGLVFHF